MHHIGLVVKDLDLSSDFYCKALGFKKGNSYTTETLDIIFLEKEKITLELI
ncbi:MAG: VOC family protein, partial [Syntrophomonadaceae bacterium]|nr:VOC family protein [Syntrophomonadaceae bacterium]